MIPILIPPYTDELFFSYIQRLSDANGCRNILSFVGRMLNHETDSHQVSHTFYNYDGRGLYVPYITETGFSAVAIEHSLYPFLAPFLTAARQLQIIDFWFNGAHQGNKMQIVLIPELHYCPQCVKDDKAEYGYDYIHRAHQLPGVTVCHKHHIPLCDEKGVTLDVTPDADDYAVFAANLMFANLQTNVDELQQLLPAQVKLNFHSTHYNKIPDIIHALMHEFKTVDVLASKLPEHDASQFLSAINGKYDLCSDVKASIVELRNKQDGTRLFTTPDGFMSNADNSGSNIEADAPKSFEEQVKALVGDEYTVIGEFKTTRTPIEIRHNTCGHVQTYMPHVFLNGGRCKKCTKIIGIKIIPQMIDYVTSGQYQVTRAGRNLCEFKEQGGAVIEMSAQRFLQEIYRPTPSDVLPVPVKNIRTDWNERLWNVEEKPAQISTKDVYDRICSIYKDNDLIFMEDLRTCFPDNFQTAIKSSVRALITKGKLYSVDKGIYSLTPLDISPEKLITEKYLVRNGKRIGIYDSKSLAFEMGMAKEKPDTIFIMSNIEPGTHGRNLNINGVLVHIRGNPILITEENYHYIMVMEALKYCWHYDSGYFYRIPQFIAEYNLSLDIFNSILPFYTKIIRKQFGDAWRFYEQNYR